MDTKDTDSSRFKVAEALPKDVGRAIARVDPEDLDRLKITVGDIVEVKGKRATFCRVMPSFKEMRGQGRIQLDGLSRTNAGVGLDEYVELRGVACPLADKLVVEPVNMTPKRGDWDYIAGKLDGLPVVQGDRIRVNLFGSGSAEFTVLSTAPKGPVLIGPPTHLDIAERAGSTSGQPAAQHQSLSYEDVGGLKPQLQRIREMIELPLRYPQVFERLGIDAPKGVLLYGPPGCGKTLIARAIAQETEANFFSVSGPEIIHKFYGESEAHLRKIFEEASRKSPSIIFLDEIDAIAPKRDQVVGDVEKRVVAQLLALMDGLNRRPNLIVIAATNLPNSIDPALRRPGRFDREISIPIPDRHGRQQILEIHSRGMPLAEGVDMGHLADITHGYVGADLEALCREAAMICLRGLMQDIDFGQQSIPYEQLRRLEISNEHFLSALREVEPSAVREVFVEVPTVGWQDVGGLETIKQSLIEAVIWPLKFAEF
ncbi:MAG: AAA family ATPase, partial [Gammaproteobacteria bacterium]|nr:AAA family ATPase [Gammaproteobacteria bacterium]